MSDTAGTLKVEIQRCNDGNSWSEQFSVPAYESQTVLDVVSWIQQNTAPSLSYRFACRVGMCGSCAMMVNGVPRWGCRTHVNKAKKGSYLHLAPLRNLPVIKDLVVDMDPFFDKWLAAEGLHHPSLSRNNPVAKILPTSVERQRADAGIECINCAICYAACDTVAGNDDYLGPAALQRAWTIFNDSRDENKTGILEAVSGEGGCQNCHSMGSCSAHCPNELDPMSAIAGLKRELTYRVFRKSSNRDT